SWRPIVPWIEQLMEESLGKGSKGVVVFEHQPLNVDGICFRADGALAVGVLGGPQGGEQAAFMLQHLDLVSGDTAARLAALATAFLGWQLTMALYGYLADIAFAGQPAVEDYKTRARALREHDPVGGALASTPSAQSDGITLLSPLVTDGLSLAAIVASALS